MSTVLRQIQRQSDGDQWADSDLVVQFFLTSTNLILLILFTRCERFCRLEPFPAEKKSFLKNKSHQNGSSIRDRIFKFVSSANIQRGSSTYFYMPLHAI